MLIHAHFVIDSIDRGYAYMHFDTSAAGAFAEMIRDNVSPVNDPTALAVQRVEIGDDATLCTHGLGFRWHDHTDESGHVERKQDQAASWMLTERPLTYDDKLRLEWFLAHECRIKQSRRGKSWRAKLLPSATENALAA